MESKEKALSAGVFRHIESGKDVLRVDWIDNISWKYTLSDGKVLVLSSSESVGLFLWKDNLGNIYTEPNEKSLTKVV